MYKKKLAFLLVFMLLFSGFSVIGCHLGSEQGGQVVFAIWSAPDGVFNFNLHESRYDADSMGPIFDGMLGLNPDLTFYYNLAEEWEIREDGRVFYYKLRDDIYFHDGEPVTTADIRFTFEWMMHQDYTGVRAGNWAKIIGFDDFKAGKTDNVEGIKVLNDREIEFHFAEVDAPAHLSVSTWPISPKHVFEGTPIGELQHHKAITNPIGSGPFKFVRYVEGAFVEMVRNENYHRGIPRLERIIVKVANPDAAQLELLTGGVDAAWMTPNAEDWAVFKDSGFLSIVEYPANSYQYMALHNEHELFQDRRVRQAITYAIDRFSMVEELLDGMGVVQAGHMSSVSWAFNEDLQPRPFDPERARTLLNEAGWTLGDDGILKKDGTRFEFTLDYPTGDPVRENSALIIQKNLRYIGIEVNLNIMDFSALLAKVFPDADGNLGEFDAYLMSWILGADPDASIVWGNDAGWNAWRFVHPDNQRLLDAGRATVDIEKRKLIYDEWQQLIFDENPVVFLYAANEAYVFDSALRGFNPGPFGIWFDLIEWHWAN